MPEGEVYDSLLVLPIWDAVLGARGESLAIASMLQLKNSCHTILALSSDNAQFCCRSSRVTLIWMPWMTLTCLKKRCINPCWGYQGWGPSRPLTCCSSWGTTGGFPVTLRLCVTCRRHMGCISAHKPMCSYMQKRSVSLATGVVSRSMVLPWYPRAATTMHMSH